MITPKPTYGPSHRWDADNLDRAQGLIDAQILWLEAFALELQARIVELEQRIAKHGPRRPKAG